MGAVGEPVRCGSVQSCNALLSGQCSCLRTRFFKGTKEDVGCWMSGVRGDVGRRCGLSSRCSEGRAEAEVEA